MKTDLSEDFKKELKDVKRKGIQELTQYLESTDFFTAPASTKFHGAVEGGLAFHSLCVLDVAKHLNEILDPPLSAESVVICSLFHDLCKANFYVRGKRNKKIGGAWKEIETWDVKDQFPMGHGEKSVYLIQKYMALTDEEALAIRWHLGPFDPGTLFFYPSGGPCSQTFRDHKLPALIASADFAASHLLEIWAEE